MNQFRFLPVLCFLLLVLLLAAPCLAATVTCPSTCSCLLPAEAQKAGLSAYCSGKKTVCDTDAQNNEKYCYAKTVAAKATTTTVPPPQGLIAFKPVATTTPTTKPTTAVASDFSVSATRLVPVTCPSSCVCAPEEKALGAAVPLSLCGGKKTWCGNTAAGVSQYCYALPETGGTTPAPVCPSGCVCTSDEKAAAAGLSACGGKKTACDKDASGAVLYCYSTAVSRVSVLSVPTVTGTTIPPARQEQGSTCAAGCACLLPRDADVKGLKYCNGKQTPCTARASLAAPGTVPDTGTRYCYSLMAESSVPAPVQIPAVVKASPIPIPDAPGKDSSGAGPAEGGNILSMFGSFLSSVLRGNPQQSLSGEVSLSACRARYGLDTCADGCVNLSTDPDNCGSCGHWCLSGEHCSAGRCVNLHNDPANCGGFGNACPAGAPCIEGYCSALGCLDSALTDCNNTCTNTRNDELNCGACGNVCPAGQDCIAATCTPCSAAGKMYCPVEENSYLSCTNITSDRDNCGRCQHACGSHEVCSGGICGECPAGTNFCHAGFFGSGGSDGGCVDLNTSATNCGGCGRSCEYGQTCQDGTCHCSPPLTSCYNPVTGGITCVDNTTDEENCGRCGLHCSESKICSEGLCVNCPTDSGVYSLCLVGGVNKCVDKNTDEENCGFCARNCGPTGHCIEGVCRW